MTWLVKVALDRPYTFIVMALVYFVFMMGGALGYRVPPTGWKPEGWTPPAAQTSNAMITQGHVHVTKVWGIPQFWLVWVVLCMNVSAGIGVIGMASPMLQEVFGGSLMNPEKYNFDDRLLNDGEVEIMLIDLDRQDKQAAEYYKQREACLAEIKNSKGSTNKVTLQP